MRSIIIAICAAAVLSGCGPSETESQIAEARAAARDQLRDPESASFKDEKIRTLWSKDGSRHVIYCAMVNGNNAFGGKTGHKPVTVTIAAIHRFPKTADFTKQYWQKGRTTFHDEMNPDYYLDCQRPDTERKDGGIFGGYVTLGRSWDDAFRAEVDSKVPVISMDEAPKVE